MSSRASRVLCRVAQLSDLSGQQGRQVPKGGTRRTYWAHVLVPVIAFPSRVLMLGRSQGFSSPGREAEPVWPPGRGARDASQPAGSELCHFPPPKSSESGDTLAQGSPSTEAALDVRDEHPGPVLSPLKL